MENQKLRKERALLTVKQTKYLNVEYMLIN